MDRIAEKGLGECSPSFPTMVEPEIILDDEKPLHTNNLEEVLLAVVNEADEAYTNAVVACAVLGVKFRYNTSPRSTLKH